MKKNILLFMTAIFATVLLFGVASAVTTNTFTTTLSQDGGSFDINVTNNNATDSESFTISVNNIPGASVEYIWFTVDGATNTKDFTLASNTSQVVTIEYEAQSGFDFDIGETYSTVLSVAGDNTTLTFEKTSFCGNTENDGKLEVGNIELNTISGFGDDDNFWYLRDVVEVEFDVENNGRGDVENMEVEWSIYVDGEEVMDGTESIVDLDENDDTTVTFEIKLDENIDEFENGDVVLYVKAFGDIDKNDNEALDGDETCDSNSESVDVITRDDFVIVDEFKINNKALEDGLLEEKLTCGSEVTVTAQVWNIGEDDQDEVTVEIYSKLLGLHKKIDVGDIDAYDSFDLEYTFTLPEEMDLVKNYRIQYEVFDDGNDLFENDENDESIFYNYFKATGNCVTIAPTVGAELVTDAFSGKEMTVQATVRNNEPNSVVYTLSADGFNEWAERVSVTPEVISLEAGEEKVVEFTFKVASASEGDYSFNIQTIDNGETVLVQPAAVTITKKGLNLGVLSEKENLKLAGIIALNLIFVALIIIVARKILRRK